MVAHVAMEQKLRARVPSCPSALGLAQMVSCQPGVLQCEHRDSWLLGSAWVGLKGQRLFTNSCSKQQCQLLGE